MSGLPSLHQPQLCWDGPDGVWVWTGTWILSDVEYRGTWSTELVHWWCDRGGLRPPNRWMTGNWTHCVGVCPANHDVTGTV